MKNTTKIRAVIGVGAAVLAASALLSAAPAGATSGDTGSTATFLRHVHAMGFQGGHSGDSDLVAAGFVACQAVHDGTPISMLQAKAEQVLIPKGYTVSDADRFVTYAISDLCPDAVGGYGI